MILTAAALVVLAPASVRIGRGQGDPDPAAPVDLLRAEPFDRVTLIDNSVYLVAPISPRPLPEYDAAKAAREAREREERKRLGRPRRATRGDAADAADVPPEAAEDEEPTVNLLLLGAGPGPRDVKVKRRSIRSVEYFEDILLSEAERLAIAGKFTAAFEHLMRVKLREPNWPGLDEKVNGLLLSEGTAALGEGDESRGLRILRELHQRRPDYPGLADSLAGAYGARAARAFELGRFDRGRRAIQELRGLAPEHPAAIELADRYRTRAAELADRASRSVGFERLDRLVEALRIWPDLDGGEARLREAFADARTIEVGVLDFPRPLIPWVRSNAAARCVRLAFLPILSSDDVDATEGKRPDQLAAGLERVDLGRRLILRIRQDLRWSDGSRPVTSVDVARALTDRAEPSSPGYDARWSELLDRVEAVADDRVEIGLARAVLNPASWLVVPVGPAHADHDGLVPSAGMERLVVGDGPFPQVLATAENRLEFRAGEPSDPTTGPNIRRVVERRIPDAQSGISALLSGEIALLESVPSDRVQQLASAPRVKVGRYEHPSQHLLALDGRNPALRSRTLRRALVYAIDRRALLEESLLRRAADAKNLLSDGPFARGSYADAPDVKPLGYDPLLARMLTAAAERELEVSAIKLSLEYPSTTEARAVVPKMAEMLREAGLQIEVVERPEPELEQALRSGRRFDLAYRATRCIDPATEAGVLICPGYDSPAEDGGLASLASPRILQLLLALDRAPEAPSARGLLLQIDRESRDELPVIPLWQLEDHYAWHDRLTGPADVSSHLYSGIARWEIEPWFPRDPS